MEPLERAIWEVADVEYVYSAAQSDGALVTARFKVGTEPELALTRLYGKLMANMDRMPAGATPPFITLHGINEVPILTLTLSGGNDAGDGYLLRQQAVELAAELKRIPGRGRELGHRWGSQGGQRDPGPPGPGGPRALRRGRFPGPGCRQRRSPRRGPGDGQPERSGSGRPPPQERR